MNLKSITSKVSESGTFISVTDSLKDIETLLNAQYHEYSLSERDQRTIRTERYSIPERVVEPIEFVSHTVTFPHFSTRILSQEKSRQATGSVTPPNYLTNTTEVNSFNT